MHTRPTSTRTQIKPITGSVQARLMLVSLTVTGGLGRGRPPYEGYDSRLDDPPGLILLINFDLGAWE